MNNNILIKCINELKSDKPKIDYILGMLETLVEIDAGKTVLPIITPTYAEKIDHSKVDEKIDEVTERYLHGK